MLPSQQLKGHWITNTLNILGPGNKELVFFGAERVFNILCVTSFSPFVPLFVAKQIYCIMQYMYNAFVKLLVGSDTGCP